MLPCRSMEQASQDRRREMERDVSGDDGGVERMPQGVGLLDAHGRLGASEGSDAALVDVDGGEISPELDETGSEGAAAGTDLEDRPLGSGYENDDAVDGGLVDEEVLAEFVTATVDGTGTHERSRMRFGAPLPAGGRGRAAGVRGLPEDGAITRRSAIGRQARRSRIEKTNAVIGAAHIVPMPTSLHRGCGILSSLDMLWFHARAVSIWA